MSDDAFTVLEQEQRRHRPYWARGFWPLPPVDPGLLAAASRGLGP
jgi:hypothetical protein